LTPGILGNSTIGSTFQNAEQTEFAGSSKRRVTEESFLKEDNKKSRIDVVGTSEEHTFKSTEETRQAQRSLQSKPQEFAGRKTSTEQDLAIPLGRKCFCSGLLKFPNPFQQAIQLNFSYPNSLKETYCHSDAISVFDSSTLYFLWSWKSNSGPCLYQASKALLF
jgi:hypothetical protein